MKRFGADLHIHTALSPCAAEEMTPPAIVREALAKGLDMIGICDHNTAGNVAAVCTAARDKIAVLPGMEIMTVEEVHVVALFPDAEAACRAGDEVRETLPLATRKAKREAPQRLMDAEGHVIGLESRLLSTASRLTLSEAVDLIRRHGGVAVAAHADRPSFSVVSQLGAFPEDIRFDAVEISAAGFRAGRHAAFASLGLPMLVSSDSHSLEEVGCCPTVFEMHAPSFQELTLAFQGVDGRRCRLA